MTISDLIQRMHPSTLGRILEDLSEAADKGDTQALNLYERITYLLAQGEEQ